MEQRRFSGKSHWYHETQSSARQHQSLPLVPEAARVEDHFLLDLSLPTPLTGACSRWLTPARQLYGFLFPPRVAVSRLRTLSIYDRLSTALTVAQVYGVQRLCNHYAARLAPLPGPDPSRESNRRLAQITQYARQLAASPEVIDARARQQLEEVGLTGYDTVLMAQIIGYIGFQARIVAGVQALTGLPVRLIPGMEMQQEAAPAAFTELRTQWTAGIKGVEMRIASARQLESLAAWQPLPAFRLLAPILAHEYPSLDALGEIYSDVHGGLIDEETAALIALYCARINGSLHCFTEVWQHWRGADDLAEAIRQGERVLKRLGQTRAREIAVASAVQILTCAPDRFSAAHFRTLQAQGFCETSALSLLVWCALCGWLNRLNIALGDAA
ncbi:CMD domain-containing protein [Yokenella regensburgei]|uniref:carboxymuconolactone decarboxylase family protein n=1 Tax=Yokenella regensburgei TaxID=158877 RepID=UPI003F15B8EB